MDMIKGNPYISFYGAHNISPVHQDIEDLRIHMIRREKLYRQLGIAPYAFRDRQVMEIGPGGGYNSVALFAWGASVDFIEPNPTAQSELDALMKKYGVIEERWSLFKGSVEDYRTDKTYDIVLAEGFIPGLTNRSEVLASIISLVNPGGVAVVTCLDDISFLLENIRRIIAVKLTTGIETFDKKIGVLVSAFASHLKALKYSSRPAEDWVADQFLNPAIYGDFFSMADCITEFGEEFDILGSSPQLFRDLSWYKEFDFDFSAAARDQFSRKRHILLWLQMEDSDRDSKLNERLFKACTEIRRLGREYETTHSTDTIENIIDKLREIINLTEDLDYRITEVLTEAMALLKDEDLNTQKVANANKFAGAFGRGQQYVSMVKRFTL